MSTHPNYTAPCGLILIAIGLTIRYYIGRRRFNRRGIAGLQQYTAYGKAVITTIYERLMLTIANVCLIAGVFILAVAGFNHHFKF